MISARTRRGDGRLTAALDPQDAGPQDECGVFGVWAPGEDVAKLTYYGLYALQHRGQESAGIAASDGRRIAVYKDMGLVSQVFDEPTLSALTGHMAVGHCRYSTTGVNKWANAQPTLGATLRRTDDHAEADVTLHRAEAEALRPRRGADPSDGRTTEP